MKRYEELIHLMRDASVGAAQRERAFSELVRLFQDMAYGCAFAHLSDYHLAEDVAQEAFLVAYLKLASLDDPAAFPGWLRRIVQFQC